jgi:hypothetical protein
LSSGRAFLWVMRKLRFIFIGYGHLVSKLTVFPVSQKLYFFFLSLYLFLSWLTDSFLGFANARITCNPCWIHGAQKKITPRSLHDYNSNAKSDIGTLKLIFLSLDVMCWCDYEHWPQMSENWTHLTKK